MQTRRFGAREHVLTPLDMVTLLRTAINDAGGTKAYANKVGISVAFLYTVLNGKKPGPRILLDLGIEPVTRYKYVFEGDIEEGE